MAEYCDRDDLIGRLTLSGLTALADRDLDQEISEEEYVAYVDPAIASAGTFIDMYVQHLVVLADARASGNALLRDIAVDLAVERIATIGGSDPSLAIHVAAERARKYLRLISDRSLVVPGLAYARPGRVKTGNNLQSGAVVNFYAPESAN